MTAVHKYKPVINTRERDDVLGGIKITILNYAKDGESRFNIVSTNGRQFHTNDRQKFLDYLKTAI